MIQLASYGFTTVENPLSDGGNFSPTTWSGSGPLQVPSAGVCESTTLNLHREEVWTGNVWPADQYSEITIGPAFSATGLVYAIVRMASPGVRTYYVLNINFSGVVQLYKGVAGAFTQLGTGSATVSVGDVWRLTVSGTTLLGFQNGILVLFASDSSIASGSPGLGILAQTAIADTQVSKWAAGGNVGRSLLLLGVGT